MLGSSVMFTPKGFEVNFRVSRIAPRRASGFGWVRAVRMPRAHGLTLSLEGTGGGRGRKGEYVPRPPAFDTAAASGGNPTL